MLFTLEIGGYRIAVHEPHEHRCLVWPIRPFEAFLVEDSRPADITVEVAVVPVLPDLPNTRLRFDSNHGHWKLFESHDGLLLDSLSPKTLTSRARACLSPDYRRVSAWVLPDDHQGQAGWLPMHLFNPILEICLLSILAREGGLLLHASGLLYQDMGFVFTGASGTGKSTLAGWFAERNARVLSDERMILRRNEASVTMFGTPWIGSGAFAANAWAPLSRLFCIRHGEERHRFETLPASRIVSFLLQQTFLPYWDRAAMDATLDSLIALTQQIPCVSLACLKHPNVVEAIMDHHLSTPMTAV
ncbi:MAG: hypothetical protein IT389_08160 [Nitrospira sp.]|nr:hypothetical protein [Nitrospira sp.]